MIRRYTRKRDIQDHRDLRFKLGPRPPIPPNADLSAWLGPVRDQANQGSCTAHAWCGVRNFLYRRYFQYEKERKISPDAFDGSPAFVYYKERELEGDPDQDNGAQMRTGARVLSRFGVCLESHDPYRSSEFTSPPTEQQLEEALLYRAGAYHRIIGIDSMRECIASGYVFALGMAVYESFESPQAAKTGFVPIPNPTERLLGGHAVVAYLYDDDAKLIGCRNSWGASWGKQGNFFLPYEYAANGQLVDDCWMIHLGRPW